MLIRKMHKQNIVIKLLRLLINQSILTNLLKLLIINLFSNGNKYEVRIVKNAKSLLLPNEFI